MVEEQFSESGQKEALALSAQIEAILFVAPEPISPYQISTILGESAWAVKKGLDELAVQYQHRGIRLQHHDGKVQLVSAPETAPLIETFLDLESTSSLSQAALETLSIIAYQQPVTRPQVDAVRGVNSDGVLKTLISKGLIEEGGRAESPGRPILYHTTNEFLKYFGLTSYEELPPLDIEDHQHQAVPEVLKG